MDVKNQAIQLLQKSTEKQEFLALVFHDEKGELISNCGEESLLSIIIALTNKLVENNMCCEAHFMQLNMILVGSMKEVMEKALDKGFEPEVSKH
jgi:hypothetical protein